MRLLYYDFVMPYLLKDDKEIVGGAAVQWKSWINGFTQNGHQFGLLTFQGAHKFINKKLSLDIVESYNPQKGIKKIRIFYYYLPKMYLAVKKYKPDYLIQASAKYDTALLMIVSKLTGVPFIHRIAHDTHVDERINEMVEEKGVKYFKFGLKYSDFIFAQNTYQYERLKEKFPRKKIFLIPNPFEVENTLSDLLSRSERSYIAWVGNFRYMKNMQALVKVAQRLPHIDFKIVGKKHSNIDKETEIAIQELEKLKNVEFTGYLRRTEIKDLYSHAIALINTSLFEGFSNTFLEAWSYGVPVVSTINVNPDEIISKNNLGKIVENYDELTAGIDYILKLNNNDYKDLSINCFEYVKKYHDPKMLAAKFVKYLENSKN